MGLQSEEIKELSIFKIGKLLCGLPLNDIQEINKNFDITPVPGAKDEISGVLNLRGQIVTIIDLRVKFGIEVTEVTSDSRNIIIFNEQEAIGLHIDKVEDIITVESQRLAPPPARMEGVDKTFFQAIYKRDDDLIAILDLEKILSSEIIIVEQNDS